MTPSLLMPPYAFLLSLLLVGLLNALGRYLAGPERPNPLKSSIYSSGEAPLQLRGAMGYRPFFLMALFFAVLHLGVLMLGSSHFTPLSALYLSGLLVALIALILG